MGKSLVWSACSAAFACAAISLTASADMIPGSAFQDIPEVSALDAGAGVESNAASGLQVLIKASTRYDDGDAQYFLIKFDGRFNPYVKNGETMTGMDLDVVPVQIELKDGVPAYEGFRILPMEYQKDVDLGIRGYGHIAAVGIVVDATKNAGEDYSGLGKLIIDVLGYGYSDVYNGASGSEIFMMRVQGSFLEFGAVSASKVWKLHAVILGFDIRTGFSGVALGEYNAGLDVTFKNRVSLYVKAGERITTVKTLNANPQGYIQAGLKFDIKLPEKK
jgi:hypothetical protein